jgi:2-oxoisovalerate dehydrogenase E2 component (dihydrolipoyl transacylase)
MNTFALPDLGEGLQEAEIVAWHVAEGDHVTADQPLVSVETEKAVVEVPSPQAGRIARLLAKTGERVKVGAPLVEFEVGAHPDTGAVVGDIESPAAPLPPTSKPAARVLAGGAVKATPAVRVLARERGVDLSKVAPTGPDGTITREDVTKAAETGPLSGAAEPLKGVRRSMALNMARSHASVAPATLFDQADVEGWWSATADVTVRLIRGIAAGAAASPALNGWYDGERLERRIAGRVDLGIAVDTEAGLIVPVLKDVGARNLAELREAVDRMKAAVHDRTVALADLRGATITLSNFGTLAGRHAALVIAPPQIAIVGAGRIAVQAVPDGGGVAFHHDLPLSLTFDHRVVTGGEAARFLKAVIENIEQPQ